MAGETASREIGVSSILSFLFPREQLGVKARSPAESAQEIIAALDELLSRAWE
jgi:hypothetical protein